MREERRAKRKWPWIIGGLLLVGIAVAVALFLLRPPDNLPGLSGPTAPRTGETATAFVGDLASSASASGRVQAMREAALALATSGRVEAVTVEPGDAVEAGDALVILEDDALERAVAQAEQALAIQQSNLATLQAGPGEADLAAAQAAVTSAEATLADLLDGPSEEEVAQAEANLRAAQANLAAASNRLGETRAGPDQSALVAAQNRVASAQRAVAEAEQAHREMLSCEQQDDGVWNCTPIYPAEMVRPAELEVIQARENLAAAQAELARVQQGGNPNSVTVSQANVASMAAQRDAAQAQLDLLLAGPTEAEIASARSALADAEANLSALRSGPGESQIAAAEAQVEQARIGLERARNNLADAVLRAPFTGIVTAVYVSEGELSSGLAVELVDLSSLEVVLDVDEVDIGALEVGQSAVLTLDAWPDEEIESEIVAIAPAANSLVLDNTIGTFSVRLALNETGRPVRVGMTANARLLTAQREDVLLVPNRAVTPDRQTGRYYVNLVETGADGEETVQPVEVRVGLRDSQYTQILDGLQEGNTVQIGTVTLPGEDEFEEGGPPGFFRGEG